MTYLEFAPKDLFHHHVQNTRLVVVVLMPSSSFLLLVALAVAVLGGMAAKRESRRLYTPGRKRTKPNQHGRVFHHVPNRRHTVDDMSCSFFEQPLNHFVPAGLVGTFRQRYCVYNDYIRNNDTLHPIFFYTGNESPLEEYINNTGLMWENAPLFGAQVVFAEHRYEGHSLPPANLTVACMSHCSTKQALADYVALLHHLNPGSRRPVVAFGGSYGGMLSSWLRMKYPNMVAGAIAGSAPIWGFPHTRPQSIDTAYRVLQHGLNMPYPPNQPNNKKKNHCNKNLLAAWPLLQFLGATAWGRQHMTDVFRLCQPLDTPHDAFRLIEWGQSPWFDLAEGSFPYPSSYITFALHMGTNDLPAWPMQAACWNTSQLHKDWGVEFILPEGKTMSDVEYTVQYGSGDLVLDVDWDKLNGPEAPINEKAWTESTTVLGVLESLRDAVSIWFNVTKDVPCFNVTPALNSNNVSPEVTSPLRRLEEGTQPTDADTCRDKQLAEGSWVPLCCNEDMNLIITLCSGMGHDMFWPPTNARGTESYSDIADDFDMSSDCLDPTGLFGYPTFHDAWSTWMDLYYGGLRIGSHSNIVFSNGLLDPWSAGGVYATDPTKDMDDQGRYTGPLLQNITKRGEMVAVIIEFGGHHTDLMYSDENDPPCVTEARAAEVRLMHQWIEEWKTQQCNAP